MPAVLVDISIAMQHCRADAEDLTLVEVYLAAAETACVAYLNREVYKNQTELDNAIANGTAKDEAIVSNAAIVGAILLTIGHLFVNREENVAGTSVSELKMGARSLLQPYRLVNGV